MAFHNQHLSNEDVRLLSQTDVTVSVCVASNLSSWILHSIAILPFMFFIGYVCRHIYVWNGHLTVPKQCSSLEIACTMYTANVQSSVHITIKYAWSKVNNGFHIYHELFGLDEVDIYL